MCPVRSGPVRGKDAENSRLPLACNSLPGKVETKSLYVRQPWHKGPANLCRGACLLVEVPANDTQAEVRGFVAQLMYRNRGALVGCLMTMVEIKESGHERTWIRFQGLVVWTCSRYWELSP